MSVYIKGMEMPKSCYDCPLRKRIGLNIVCPISRKEFAVADVNILFYRLEDCPLIPVPDHGRLGDLDVAVEILERLRDHCGNEDMAFALNWAAGSLRDLPTIIPADPADKEGEG